MATNPATPADIESRWRALSASEDTIADTLLGDAWTLLTHALPTLESRLDASTLDPNLVVMVEVAMVKRVLVNPDGLSQESIQDYSYTRQATDNGLVILPEELELLADVQEGSGGAFTIHTTRRVPAGSPVLDPDDWQWSP